VDLEKQKNLLLQFALTDLKILARTTAKGMGMPNLALVIVPHPIGGISPEEVKVKAGNILI